MLGELGAEVAQPVDGQERRHHRGHPRHDRKKCEADGHHHESGNLQLPVADLVDPRDAEYVAGYGRDDEDRKLDADRGHYGCRRRDQRDYLRHGDRVPVVRVVQEEPASGRSGQGQQQPAVGQERAQCHPASLTSGAYRLHLAVGESVHLLFRL
jgi:hypothetical protein